METDSADKDAGRELSDTELENVLGGQTEQAFIRYVKEILWWEERPRKEDKSK